jgi:hypothetical protein
MKEIEHADSLHLHGDVGGLKAGGGGKFCIEFGACILDSRQQSTARTNA